MIRYTAMLCFLMLFAGCVQSDQSVNENALNSDAQVLVEWKEWAESTDEGLWEDDLEHQVHFEHITQLGGEVDEGSPLFTYVESFCVQGDTIFITDSAKEEVIAVTSSGEILWSIGGPGEGPGLFSGIGQIDVMGDVIAVVNQANSRVDILSTDGEWQTSFQVMIPYDVSMVSDGQMAVAMHTSATGCIVYCSTAGNTIAKFGTWSEHMEGWASNRDLHCTIADSKTLVLTSYYSNRVELYDLLNEQRIKSFHRTLPFHLEGTTENNGMISFQTVILDVFIGPEGMINVLLRPFADNKTVDLVNHQHSGIAVVDRFDYSGQYLDSYIIPAPASQVCYSQGVLYASCESECSIQLFRVRVGE